MRSIYWDEASKRFGRIIMIKIYGMPSCPDCQVIAPQVMQHLDRYQPNDIGSDVRVMKEFLRLRDTNPAFDEAKMNGNIGIPCFVLEDGAVTLDPKDAGLCL